MFLDHAMPWMAQGSPKGHQVPSNNSKEDSVPGQGFCSTVPCGDKPHMGCLNPSSFHQDVPCGSLGLSHFQSLLYEQLHMCKYKIQKKTKKSRDFFLNEAKFYIYLPEDNVQQFSVRDRMLQVEILLMESEERITTRACKAGKGNITNV